MKKVLSLFLTLCVALGALPALAQEAVPSTLEDVLSRLDVAYAHRVTKVAYRVLEEEEAERQAAELIES